MPTASVSDSNVWSFLATGNSNYTIYCNQAFKDWVDAHHASYSSSITWVIAN